MNILVTGGAGYIGSHTVKELLAEGHNVVTLDNLSKGHRAAVRGGEFIHGDLRDTDLLQATLRDYDIAAVVHFAADSLVGESMAQPARYFNNNIVNGLNLLNAMVRQEVRHIVFSSSAAVYGEPAETPITEGFPKAPTNNYGLSKLMFEQILAAYENAYGLKSVSLRYFNAAGADLAGKIGEDHSPETHLIPLVLQAALGIRDKITVFGTDYPTSDGTCIRDYIHVTDLARAHILALEALAGGDRGGVYNLGNGKGFSVREVIDVAREVSGCDIPVAEGERRPGDPAVLVAGSEQAVRELGWRPQYHDLRTIVETAWNWHRQHPGGFAE